MNDTRSRAALNVVALAVSTLLISASSARGQPATPDVWEPVRFLVGDWEGSAEGQSGRGTVRRSNAFVLKDRYLHERNVSTYPPQEANKGGEIHEHWSFFSYDRERKTLVLRQFHQEGFVNRYVLSPAESGAGKLVFTSEQFENFDNRWRARETYEVRSADEFVETFELGAPGRELEVYSRNHFRRKK